MRLDNPLLDPQCFGSLKRIVDSVRSARSFENLGIAQTGFISQQVRKLCDKRERELPVLLIGTLQSLQYPWLSKFVASSGARALTAELRRTCSHDIRSAAAHDHLRPSKVFVTTKDRFKID